MSVMPPVPHKVPMLDVNGMLTPAWSGFFTKLYQRIGGNIASTNDELGNISTSMIQDDAVTFPKIQNIATDTLIGRDSASTGDPESITVGGGIEFSGAGVLRTSAFTGDVTKSAGGTAQTIANDAVSFIKMLSTDWTNTKSASGGTKLPNGIYLRWGVTASIATATTSSTSFASAFPTGCLQVIASPQGNSASSTTATGHWGTGNYSTTAFDMYNRTSITLTFNYLAVGY